ncbi:hypothetical protein QBC47DRAFT_383336 [Echria macrotheca]|uniref:DNA polymerase lambda n=1 Tax=Echria macrotheca TaxID=438768 RepID=A0AAJ0BG87_9PEZI|nr:hypothetical protein QBC47DRAFT_383336 [Echria macrotheca]
MGSPTDRAFPPLTRSERHPVHEQWPWVSSQTTCVRRMDFPSLSEKAAFFDELDALNSIDDDEDDQLSKGEQEYRAKSDAFFARVKVTQPLSASAREQTFHPPRRTFSAPAPASQTPLRIIQATPQGREAADTVAAQQSIPTPGSSVIKETPVLDPTRPLYGLLHRSSTAPLPFPSSAPIAAESPSASSSMRKRKRQAPPAKSVPEPEQIFQNLAFFYIPNDDIAPMRKLRIGKAREYGAIWVRDPASASYVIVDNRLEYKDIEKILGSDSPNTLVVVNEEYPIDCITYRALLNPHQQRYKVPGFPGKDPEETTVSIGSVPRSESLPGSLPLKEPPTDAKRWDHVPRAGTPPRQEVIEISQTQSSAESKQNGTDQATRSEPQEPRLDESIIRSSHPTPEISDELSEYIELMQKYKDVPLDVEEDDVQSVTGGGASDTESGSEGERDRRKPPTRNGSRKDITFEDRFACNRGGTLEKGSGEDQNPNARTIEILQSMCDYYSRVNDHWRTTAYRKAINTLRRQPIKIRTEEEAYRLPNIGARIAAKIEEIVSTNALRRLDYARDEPLDAALAIFLGIYGVGTSIANRWLAKGYRTLEDLMANPPSDLTPNQRLGIEHYEDLNTRIPREEVTQLGAYVKREAAVLDPGVELLIGGSYRRGSPTSGDIDFIVTKKGTTSAAELVPFLEDLIRVLTDKGFLVATLAALHSTRRPDRNGEPAGSKWHGCCVLPETERPAVSTEPDENGGEGGGRKTGGIWRRIDFLLVPETEYGAALIYFTGNDIFNRSLRLLASKKGMRLNQRGLYKEVMRGPGRLKTTEGELVEGRDERRIFEILGVKWREPWERWC